MACGLMVLLGACSKDEVAEVNRDGDEITFNVVANSASRAANVYCNNNNPGAFVVSAISGGASYIDGDDIAYVDNKWVNQDGVRYWPEEDAVDFYAHVNGGTNYKWAVTDGKASAKFEDFEVKDKAAEQVDLLYAVKTGETKGDDAVVLNFRHALSQVVFQAKNTNKNMYVEIAGVTVCNLVGKNTFTFPSASTDGNIVNHDGNMTEVPSAAANWGTWAELTTPGAEDYEVTFANVPVKGNSEIVALTTADDATKNGEYNSNTLLLLPQDTKPWEPSTIYPQPGMEGQTGSYFLVKCMIFNVADGSGEADANDKCIWGDKVDEKWVPANVAIPVDINWEQGKKYIYTFVFGDGNGGYDPEDPDPDPDPVLIPITFEITVDDFVTVGPEDINMETEEEETTTGEEGQGN